MRVLVVEDDVVTAARIEIVLQGEDFICDLAHRGEVGIQYGKLHAYDIILLDLMLPDMDGYDVLQQLREAEVNTPVLILSGLGELDDTDAGKRTSGGRETAGNGTCVLGFHGTLRAATIIQRWRTSSSG